MRKNKITGAIPNAGRKKGNDDKHTVHLTITKKAKLILDKKMRMDKGNFVSGLIENSEKCTRCDKNQSNQEHTCPYAEEINNDSETMCNCCDSCAYECSLDI